MLGEHSGVIALIMKDDHNPEFLHIRCVFHH